MGYRAATSLGALFAKGVTGGCEGDLLSTQDGSCCGESDFTDITYRSVVGLGSWMMINEVRAWNAIMTLVQTPTGRGFSNGLQALAYDKGFDENSAAVSALAAQIISAFDGFARLFPHRRLAVVQQVNVGAKNCGPYPVWGQNLTPQTATFDANARARFVAAVPSAPASYLDAMTKSGTLEYLWHFGEAWSNALSAPNGLGMPAPPLPVMQWLRRALIVLNSDPLTFTATSGFTDSHTLIGMRQPITADQLVSFTSGQPVPSPWLTEMINVFPPPATAVRAPGRAGIMRIATPGTIPTPTTTTAATITTSSKTPWIVAAVAVPIVIGGAVWWKYKRGA